MHTLFDLIDGNQRDPASVFALIDNIHQPILERKSYGFNIPACSQPLARDESWVRTLARAFLLNTFHFCQHRALQQF
ncbi:hypothetical protein VNO77_34302 [Canavalia gladiata]|uniref:Uncharacterized protein n=1 Tax=Canavalia gladiata TaxID=3824 RepID=A0AAN9KE32_CANGL